MIRPDEISEGDIVRLRSGSPKFIVSDIDMVAGKVQVEIFGWSDRQGFVSRFVPIGWLCWPRPEGDPVTIPAGAKIFP